MEMEEERGLAPISALNQLLYCAHRCYLMHVCGEMEDNEHVWRGRRLHRRSDRGEGGRVKDAQGEGVQVVRARPVESARLRIAGVIDVVEFPAAGPPRVVEFKRGRAPADGAWRNDAIQVCAQALCLEEELGVRCAEAFIYYEQSGGRRRVELDEGLRAETEAACLRLRRILRREEVPAPREGPQCEGCSLRGICMPRAYELAGRARDPWEAA
jgi:CRISPR-associated exonuclease Cas4